MYIISRDVYLENRKRWRELYMKLSKNIRALKIATKLAAKGGYTAAAALQSLRAHGSNEAFDMMLDLEELKKMSRVSVAFMRWMEGANSPGAFRMSSDDFPQNFGGTL